MQGINQIYKMESLELKYLINFTSQLYTFLSIMIMATENSSYRLDMAELWTRSSIYNLESISLTMIQSSFKLRGDIILLQCKHLEWLSLQNSAHGTTAMLSWHGQNFVVNR